MGIVLGGGGARGFAHLGVLQALQEDGIKPDIISGVSAGAIAGAFIASGKSPLDSFKIIKDYKFFDITRLRLPRAGIFSLDSVGLSINQEIAAKTLEELEIPLVVAATDMLEGKVRYFKDGPLDKIIQASSAIPVLFNPVEIQGKIYSDGGIFDNLPLAPIKELCKFTIVVDISPIQRIDELKSIVQVASRMFQLSVNAGRLEKRRNCDVYIEPLELRQYEVLDTKHAHEIFEVGYNHTKALKIHL